MPQLLKTKNPVARKVHYCQCCGGPAVQPGEKYQRDTYLYDGMVYDWVMCTGCAALVDLVWRWAVDADEGLSGEDYIEWAREHADHPEHGEQARAFLVRAKVEKD